MHEIEEYRKKYEEFRQFEVEHGSEPNNGDLAAIVLESLAKAGSTKLYAEVDEEVQRLVLRDLRHYKRTGKREILKLHANQYMDGRTDAQAAIVTLAEAGLVSQSMVRTYAPTPTFEGLESIQGSAPLIERVSCEDGLLDVQLVGLCQNVPNPIAYPNLWTMLLQITEHERCQIDEVYYERRPVRSCVATFLLHKWVSMYFWPRFSFGYLSYFHITHEPRARGQTALKIKLDFGCGDKGRVFCREMELIRLDEISCEWKA